MSIKIMSSIWDLQLDSNLKLICLALADHATDEGICISTLDDIALKCGLSKRNVIRIINKVIEIGIISRLNQRDSEGKIECNLYIFCTENIIKFKNVNDRIPSDNLSPGIRNFSPSDNLSPGDFNVLGTTISALKDFNNLYKYNINKDNNNYILDNKEKHRSPTQKKVEKRIHKIAQKMPNGFCVTEEHRNYAMRKSLPNPDEHIDAFCEYHLARASKFVKWDMAFYTWLRNARKFDQKRYSPIRKEADVIADAAVRSNFDDKGNYIGY